MHLLYPLVRCQILDSVLTFNMAVAPDATEEELSYAEKWRYVIQLRSVCVFNVSITEEPSMILARHYLIL